MSKTFDYQEITRETILAALPGSPADILWVLGRADEYLTARKSVYSILESLQAEGLVSSNPRPADDSWYYRR